MFTASHHEDETKRQRRENRFLKFSHQQGRRHTLLPAQVRQSRLHLVGGDRPAPASPTLRGDTLRTETTGGSSQVSPQRVQSTSRRAARGVSLSKTRPHEKQARPLLPRPRSHRQRHLTRPRRPSRRPSRRRPGSCCLPRGRSAGRRVLTGSGAGGGRGRGEAMTLVS